MRNQNPSAVLGNRTAFLLQAVIVLLTCLPAAAQDVQIYVSSKAGDRFTSKPELHFEQRTGSGSTGFEIDDSVAFQRMDGFGASMLEAGLIILNDLPPADQESVLRALFDPKEGAGFTAMKTVLASTDFMSAGPFYTYDPVPGDVEMNHFSIARDLQPNGLITFIKRARRYGKFVLQAPMDYPPDWMLFDVDTNQDVNPKYYDALARYYLRYLQEYEKNGISIDYMSLFNEHGFYTNIPLWMTEVCYAYEAGTPKSMSLPRYEFEDGDFWGTQIFNDLEAHASAWIYWNMVLDEKGGPWSVSYVHGNPDPNIQHPVVIIDRQTKKVTYTGLYYYLAHFSRFVRPGAVRVKTSGSQDGIRAMAFKRPDGGMVLEIMNSRKEDIDVNVSWHGRLVRLKLAAVSITTALWNR